MKYAADNRVVQAIYSFTTDYKPVFIALVIAALLAGIYFPVRDYYVAVRTQNILEQQVAIREKYNNDLSKEVDQYLSQEGIEDAARKDLGMVMPGEKTITVEGLDEDGNPVVEQPTDGTDSSGSSDGQTSGDDGSGSATSDASGDTGTGSDSTADSGSSDEDSGKLKGADAADKSKTGTSSSENATTDNPKTSAEVEAAEEAVMENSAWYWKLLDTVFFFDGTGGMAVTSTGSQE